MDLQGAFRARLLANATIAAHVTKIAWGGLPQKTALPYLRLTKAATGQEWTHDGPDPLLHPWVQIDIFAAPSSEVGVIVRAIEAEMQRLDNVTIEGWSFLPPGIVVRDFGPELQELPGGGQAFLISQDYRFWAVPA